MSLLQIVQNHYAHLSLVELTLIRTGLNHMYHVKSSTQSYVFRVYRNSWRNLEQIQFEIDALTHIAPIVSAVIAPIRTTNAEWMVTWHDNGQTNYGVLFEYAAGQEPPYELNQAIQVATLLAQLHTAAENWQTKSTRGYSIDEDELIASALPIIEAEMVRCCSEEDVQWMRNVGHFLINEIKGRSLSWGFCHGDAHHGNMHFDPMHAANQFPLRLFDFDCCGLGYQVYDLAVYAWSLYLHRAEQADLIWDAFLEQYRSLRSLSDADVAAIPLFVMARRFWLAKTLLTNRSVFGEQWISREGFGMFLAQLREDVQRFQIECISC